MTRRSALAWAPATVFLALTRALELRMNAGVVGGSIDVGSGAFAAGLAGAAAIHAGLIVWLASRSQLRDPARIYALIWIGVGFVIVNNVEAAIFDIAPLGLLTGIGALASLTHAIAVVGICRLIPVRQDLVSSETARPRPSLVMLRVVTLGVVYAVVYFVAGGLIYPFVRDFYTNKPLPSGGALFAVQAFARGPIFVAIGLFVVRLVGSRRREAVLATACTLSGLGGLTALLVPNALFPDSVRLVHLAEVGISNAVFGLIVGWVLTRR
jgi:hypothetical protein